MQTGKKGMAKTAFRHEEKHITIKKGLHFSRLFY